MRLTKSPLSRYALPVITVGSAFGLTIVLKSLHWPHPFTFYFLAAIAVTFWFGGTGPGVFSLILASIVFNFVFTPPPGSDSSRLYYVINFVIVALLIAWVSASRRRAENLLDQARGELEIKVNERTASLRRANEELSGEVAERKKAEQALRASDQVTRGQAKRLSIVSMSRERAGSRKVFGTDVENNRATPEGPKRCPVVAGRRDR